MRCLLLFISCFIVFISFGQTVQPFKNKQLINAQTTVIPDGFDFTIQHRFGQIALDDSFYEEFLGFDLPANIRFSLSQKINDRLYVGVGRTKVGKTVDFEGKYLICEQNKDESIPFSVALFSSVGVRTQPFDVNDNMFFADSITPFNYLFVHKLDYNTQLILSKSLTDKIAFQLAPTVVYKNLVEADQNNFNIAIPFSGKYQYSFGSAVVFEYGYCLGREGGLLAHPLSVGVEFGTAGHVFQFFMTNNSSLRESNLYTTNGYDYSKTEFLFGFNIRRVWWF